MRILKESGTRGNAVRILKPSARKFYKDKLRKLRSQVRALGGKIALLQREIALLETYLDSQKSPNVA